MQRGTGEHNRRGWRMYNDSDSNYNGGRRDFQRNRDGSAQNYGDNGNPGQSRNLDSKNSGNSGNPVESSIRRDRLGRFVKNHEELVQQTKGVIDNKIKLKSAMREIELHSVEDLFKDDMNVADDYKNCYVEEFEVSGTQMNTVDTMTAWTDLLKDENLLKNIKSCGYDKPTKVQQYVVPLMLAKESFCISSRTGSGKTAAYMIPIIESCLYNKTHSAYKRKEGCPYAIVLATTRELAMQYCEQGRKFANGTGLNVSLAVGGFHIGSNENELQNVDILCATVGRLLHLFGVSHNPVDYRAKLFLENLKIIVFDEADELIRDYNVNTTLKNFLRKADKPYQVAFLSASLVKDELFEKIKGLELCSKGISLFNDGRVLPTNKAEHIFREVEEDDKFDQVKEILREHKTERILVFCRDRETVEFLVIAYALDGINATVTSGLNEPEARTTAMRQFGDGDVYILFTTELLCRGIDIKHLDFVVNYDMPENATAFVHRVGRCGRIRKGKTISFVTKKDAAVVEQLKEMYGDTEMPETLRTLFVKNGQ